MIIKKRYYKAPKNIYIFFKNRLKKLFTIWLLRRIQFFIFQENNDLPI